MKNISPIIPVISEDCQVKSWKNLLKTAVSDPIHLLTKLGLSDHPIAQTVAEKTNFMTRVPQPYIDKMKFGDANDPLLHQVLEVEKENIRLPGYNTDPLKETASDQPGILHKYSGRVLLVLASACAINCRYCFRRHFPYQDNLASGKQLEASLSYIRQNDSISEVILSGGDPLIVGDGQFSDLIKKVESISHVKRLRIHTRLPVVIPQRITDKLTQTLAQSRLQSTMVLHLNHPNEIDQLFKTQIAKLHQHGITLLNQSVLLKGINDESSILCKLSERLFESSILPYYLHLLDKVEGAAHFDLAEERALNLVRDMRNKLPGYLVPRLARETPGEGSKTVLA